MIVLPQLRSLAETLLDAVYPPVCMVCSAALAESPRRIMLCPQCVHELAHDPFPTCPRCVSSIGPGTDLSEGCPRCRGTKLAFDSAFRLGPYDGKLRDAVLRMKHLHGELLAETMGLMWVEQRWEKFQALNAQAVIPIPLHFLRRWKRGYNQAESLARMVASRLNLPCRTHWLRRVRGTTTQADQSRAARQERVRGAFRITRFAAVKDLRVLLIDDVLTTGATADAAAGILRKAGAARVDVAVLAHR